MNRAGRCATRPLWAITSYFNPLGSRHRLANYRRFRERLELPLLAVELAADDEFQLRTDDADVLVQCRGRDVLWQKERLLNLALAVLPAQCTQTAWLDCDLVFDRPDWPQRVGDALQNAPLAQLFGRVRHLPQDETAQAAPLFSQPSLVAAVASDRSAGDCVQRCADRQAGAPAAGLAWAAQRWLLQRHGFYDACIVGGGDTALAGAALGCPEEGVRLHVMNERQRDRYLSWAEPFSRSVGGDVAFVDGDVSHLWHGAMNDRRSRRRHEELAPFEFDPNLDVAVAVAGCWRWNSNKPALHRHVADYFAARNEDG